MYVTYFFMYHICITSIQEHTGCFHLLVIVNNTAIDLYLHLYTHQEQVDFITEMQGWFNSLKSIKSFHHINSKNKNKNIWSFQQMQKKPLI